MRLIIHNQLVSRLESVNFAPTSLLHLQTRYIIRNFSLCNKEWLRMEREPTKNLLSRHSFGATELKHEVPQDSMYPAESQTWNIS
jgi:hypothetical protein